MANKQHSDQVSLWDWLPGALFGLPFAAAGSLALWKGYSDYSPDYAIKDETIGLLGVGILFSLIGYGLIIASFKSRSTLVAEKKLKAQHPNEPWMHRSSWAKQLIPCESKTGVIGSWIVAIIWNGISCAPLFAIAEELEKGNRGILVSLIFPLMGLFLIYSAIRTTLQWYKYGDSHLRLNAPTGFLGGQFRATIFGRQDLPADATFELTLQNIHRRVTGSGKNRRTSLNVLYEQKKSIPARNVNLRSGVPAVFTIPFDTKQSDYADKDSSFLWKLQVSSEVPGVDFEAEFEVPVFDTGKGDTSLTKESLSQREETVEKYEPEFPISPGVILEAGGSERTLIFQALREKGKAFVQALVFVALNGFLWALYGEVPTPFLAFFAVFNVFVLYALVRSLFHTKQVTIRPTEIVVMDTLLGMGHEKCYQRDEISDITTLMQPHTQSNPQYVTVLTLKNSEKVEVTEAVRDSREAEWFTRQLRQ